MEPLDRIESKLDLIDQKLDSHLERIAKTETAITWIKWVLSTLLSFSGAVGLALTKHLGK